MAIFLKGLIGSIDQVSSRFVVVNPKPTFTLSPLLVLYPSHIFVSGYHEIYQNMPEKSFPDFEIFVSVIYKTFTNPIKIMAG